MNNNNQVFQSYDNYVPQKINSIWYKNDSNYNLRQKLIRNYLGSSYDKFKRDVFSFSLFFLGWPYLMYLKQYKTGIFYMLFSLFLIIFMGLFNFYSTYQVGFDYSDSYYFFYNVMKFDLINLVIIYLGKHFLLCWTFKRTYYDYVYKKVHQLIKNNPNANEDELITMVIALGKPDKLTVVYCIIYILIIVIMCVV